MCVCVCFVCGVCVCVCECVCVLCVCLCVCFRAGNGGFKCSELFVVYLFISIIFPSSFVYHTCHILLKIEMLQTVNLFILQYYLCISSPALFISFHFPEQKFSTDEKVLAMSFVCVGCLHFLRSNRRTTAVENDL